MLDEYEGPWVDNEPQKSGWEDEAVENICRSQDHNPPTHLYIPPGKIYRHVCSGCGKVTRLRSTWSSL